jgi:ADP-heptose:LPS heptosyltransferase
MNKIDLLKRLDAAVGSLLCRLFARAGENDREMPIHRILIIRPGGIGDAVLLAPAIEALKKKFPRAALTVLAEKRNAGIFSLIEGVDQVLCYDTAKDFLAAFRLNPDIIIDTEQYHRLSAVVARLIGAGIFIGFGSNERARLFHHAIPYSHETYEVISFLRLLGPLGIGSTDRPDPPFLKIPAAAQSKASELLELVAGYPFCTIFPGASIPERRWGARRFAQVAAGIAALGYKVVIVGGREDMATASEIIATIKGLDLTGQTTLAETGAILKQSALLISGDSGILHIGVGLGIPTISLFGPGIAEKWGPRGPHHRILESHLSCSPCTRFGTTQRCPRNAECMNLISADEVVQAATMMLKKTEAPPDDQ